MKELLMYVDKFPFPDKKIVYTDNHEKIMKNLHSFPDILERLDEVKLTDRPRLVMVFNCSNYIVSLNLDLTFRQKSFMYFFDMNFNLPKLFMLKPIRRLFDPKEMQAVVDYQKKFIDNPEVAERENVTFTTENSFELPS